MNLRMGTQNLKVRLSDASSPSFPFLHSGSLSKRGSGLPLKPFTGSNLVKVAPLTFEAIARMRAVETEAIEGVVRGVA